MTNYTLRETVEIVERVISERGGDFRYTDTDFYKSRDLGCSNITWDWDEENGKRTNIQPGCIVGSFAIAANLITAKEIMRRYLDLADSNHLLDYIVSRGMHEFSYLSRRFLLTAQIVQDSGSTWDQAYVEAWRRVIEVNPKHCDFPDELEYIESRMEDECLQQRLK